MAGIDTSIYSQLLRQPKSVAEYDAEAQQSQQNRLALQAQQGQIAAQQAGIARTNRLAAVLGGFSPGASAAEQGDLLTRSGFIDEGRKVIESGAKANKDQREGEKAQREAERFQFENARDQLGFVNQIIGSARDQASYSQGRQAMAARGLDVSQIPEQYDPAYVASAGAQTLTQLQRLDQVWKQKGFDLDVEKFGEDKRRNKATEGLTARGQNMTASTAAAGRAQSESQFARTQSAGKVPAGYRANADGTMSFIPGGPADPAANGGKAPTEFQGKSAGFGARAEQADKLISGLAGKYSPAKVNAKLSAENTPLIGGIAGAAANTLLGENEQQAEQAQRDFINAILRQESGAAIGMGEFENARRQYFPQPGDKPGVLEQKAANRKLAVQGLKGSAGKAAFSAPSSAPAAALPAGWSVERN